MTGKPEVFVIAGGGNGAPVYRRLQRGKIPFSTGILWKNDIDYPVACALAAKVIAEEAFETVTAETLDLRFSAPLPLPVFPRTL